MLKGSVRLKSYFSPTVAIPISILKCNIFYSPFGESVAVNILAKEGLKILPQTLAGKGDFWKANSSHAPWEIKSVKRKISMIRMSEKPHTTSGLAHGHARIAQPIKCEIHLKK